MKLHQELIATNGIKLNVASVGAGAPIVLLHGFPDTHTSWRKQVAALVNAGYRVIMPDLRGYGASDAPPGTDAYHVKVLCADIIGLLDAMQLERVYLVGHDWGAVVGWHVCMAAPQRVERFAALSVGHPNAYAGAGIAQKLKAWYAGLFQLPGVAEAMVRAGDLMALKPQAVDEAQLDDWRANFSGEGRLTAALNYYRANRHLALGAEYPPVTVPVLGVWSEGDPALTEAQMQDSAAWVAGSFRYERLDGDIGHWLQLKEPRRVNKLLIGFGAA
ncbi:alpha/beta fold hydrolase [Massilia sp. PAMC28688]|uniref:alpha/beta fold hydrolase n=1 Tax=Massilia sp. PAMC28688 TaxID=2861283 RepID=UPI001C624854|nr:alpha/beta fold hydrolase [Massilia sp. PAMC28688]QYF94755.1 alpha/beta fold hydrolase [Massilia sp. PAMC28688]